MSRSAPPGKQGSGSPQARKNPPAPSDQAARQAGPDLSPARTTSHALPDAPGKNCLVLVSIHHEKSPQAIPLGAACIASAVRSRPDLARDWKVMLLDVWPGDTEDLILKTLDRYSPRVIGFSTYVWNQNQVEDLVGRLSARSGRPGIRPLLVIGGPSAFDPRIASLGGLDLAIQGEGEEAFCEWLSRIGPAQGKVQAPGPGAAAGEPSTRPELIKSGALMTGNLASPWLDGTLVPGSLPGVVWEAARGCPFRCSYCLESRGIPGTRPFPAKRLEAELRRFGQAKVGQIFVLDPTFNYQESRCLELLNDMDRLCPGTHVHLEVRAEFISLAQAEAYASVPCSLQIGLQSANPEVMKRLGRPFSPGLFRERINLLNQTGAVFGLDLIWGLPGDSLAGFMASLDWALNLEPNHLDLFPLSILPGTALSEEAAGLGLVWEENPPYTVRSSQGFSLQDMADAARLAGGVRFFYNQGRAVGWFCRVARLFSMTGSQLILDFLDWKDASRETTPDLSLSGPKGQEEIHRLQKYYLLSRAEKLHPGLSGLAGVLTDLVSFHSAWAALVADGTSSTCMLNHDPEVLGGPEGRRLEKFAQNRKPRPRAWRFYRKNGLPVFQPA